MSERLVNKDALSVSVSRSVSVWVVGGLVHISASFRLLGCLICVCFIVIVGGLAYV